MAEVLSDATLGRQATSPSSPPLRPLKQTLTILSISTFPKRFEPLRDRLVREAKKHPDFQGLDPDEIVRSVENRLWTVIQTYPWWYGQLKGDKPKRPASPAQLDALAKARQRKQALQDEADAPYVPGSQNLTEAPYVAEIQCEATMTDATPRSNEELTEYIN